MHATATSSVGRARAPAPAACCARATAAPGGAAVATSARRNLKSGPRGAERCARVTMDKGRISNAQAAGGLSASLLHTQRSLDVAPRAMATAAVAPTAGNPGRRVVVADVEAMRRLLVVWSKGCVGEYCGVPLSDGAVEALRSTLVDDTGAISEIDLEDIAMRTSLIASKYAMLIQVFDLLDQDKDGKLSPADLAGLLERVGKPTTPEELGKMFDAADFNRNGILDFEEFCMMVRVSQLDLAEVLAYVELASAPDDVGMLRRKQAVIQQQNQLKKVWSEITNPKMALKQTSTSSVANSPPPSPVAPATETSVASPSATTPAAEEPSTTPAHTPLLPGTITKIHSGSQLQDILDNNPEKSVCLMVGFTFCRPCKAFQRPYEKIAAHYEDVIFLFIYGNESDETTNLVKNVLKLKVSPMFYFFRGGSTGLVPKYEHSGARDYKLIDSLKSFLQKHEVPQAGHFIPSTPVGPKV